MSKIQTKQVLPKYGQNYRAGHIFFTYRPGNFVAGGITWFTRFERLGEIKVSHVGIVTGPDDCIEALASGVKQSNLTKYFTDPTLQIFFREPRVFNKPLVRRFIKSAETREGKGYGYALIVGNAIANSAIGRLFGFRKWILKAFDSENQEICSEFVAAAMAEQPEWRGLGCLKRHPREVTPQMLFEDDGIFKPWKR